MMNPLSYDEAEATYRSDSTVRYNSEKQTDHVMRRGSHNSDSRDRDIEKSMKAVMEGKKYRRHDDYDELDELISPQRGSGQYSRRSSGDMSSSNLFGVRQKPVVKQSNSKKISGPKTSQVA